MLLKDVGCCWCSFEEWTVDGQSECAFYMESLSSWKTSFDLLSALRNHSMRACSVRTWALIIHEYLYVFATSIPRVSVLNQCSVIRNIVYRSKFGILQIFVLCLITFTIFVNSRWLFWKQHEIVIDCFSSVRTSIDSRKL